jgi:hypothetical protein
MLPPEAPEYGSSSSDYGSFMVQLLRQQASIQEGRHMGSVYPTPSHSTASASKRPSLTRQEMDEIVAQLKQLSGALLEDAGDSGLTDLTGVLDSQPGGVAPELLLCCASAAATAAGLCCLIIAVAHSRPP